MQGTLKETLIPELFKQILAERMTGRLRISAGPIEKCIFFQNGKIAFATSNQPEERLGEILVREGKISAHDREVAGTYPMPGRKFGDTLVDMGKVTPDQLADSLSKQIVTIVLSVFLLQDGYYTFSDSALPPQEIRLRDLSTEDIVMEGVRKMPYREEMKSSLGPPTRPLKLTAVSYRIAEQVTLRPTEGFVLSRIDGIATLSEIAPLVPAEEIETYKMLYGLRVLGLLVGGGSYEQPADAIRDTKGASTGKTRAASAGVKGAGVHQGERPADLDTIHSNLDKLDHYQLLGIPIDCATAEIKKTYYRLAKVYHPDRFRAGGGPEAQKKAALVFARLTEAYEVLVDDKARLAYDQTATDHKKGFTRSDAQRAQERRDERMAEKAAAQSTAQETYAKGLDLFNARKYADAIGPLTEAAKANPRNVEWILTLAKAQAKHPPAQKDAEKTFLRAVNLDKLNPEPYVQMGKYYKERRDLEKAAALLQRALALDDENEEAKKEMESLPGQGGEKKSFWSRLTGR